MSSLNFTNDISSFNSNNSYDSFFTGINSKNDILLLDKQCDFLINEINDLNFYLKKIKADYNDYQMNYIDRINHLLNKYNLLLDDLYNAKNILNNNLLESINFIATNQKNSVSNVENIAGNIDNL